jgi:hypothetical protein
MPTEVGKPRLGEIDSVPAFFGFAALVEDVAYWDRDDFDEFAAEAFAGSAGGVVVGIAGDPERIDIVAAREGEQEAAGALRVMAAARGWIDVIANVAAVHLRFVGVTDAEADAAGHG